MAEEKGYIQFQCEWLESAPLAPEDIHELNHWRKECYRLGVVGVYPNGIGFGNLSICLRDSLQFIITGTKTGEYRELTPEHFTTVLKYNFDENSLTCRGPIRASSESLTHAAVYEAAPHYRAVIHIHSKELWERTCFELPTTPKEVEAGTPEMAYAIGELVKTQAFQETRIAAMAGHDEGLIIAGESLEVAGNVLYKWCADAP